MQAVILISLKGRHCELLCRTLPRFCHDLVESMAFMVKMVIDKRESKSMLCL